MLSPNCPLKRSEIQFWLRHTKKNLFHSTLIPGEYVIKILTRWEPSLTSCTCCTCGSATTLVSWSEVMSCLLFGCSERTLLVTFVSCRNRKTKDSVSGCWNPWELTAIPDLSCWFRPKVQSTSTQHSQDYVFRQNVMAKGKDKVISHIYSVPSHWLPWECRQTLATATGREIPLGKFHLILTLIIQIGFQTMASSHHLLDLLQLLRSI